MKKIVFTILSACLLLTGATKVLAFGTEYATGTIDFSVKIQNKPCTIAAGFPPREGEVVEMSLGSLSKAKDSVSPRLPVVFVFKDCKSVDAIKSIEYTNDIGGGGGHTQGFVTTDNDDVKVYLYTNETSNDPFKVLNYPQAGGKPIVDGEWITVCYAQAKVGSNGSAKVGDFKGQAEFTVTYN